jgi:arsenate reductase
MIKLNFQIKSKRMDCNDKNGCSSCNNEGIVYNKKHNGCEKKFERIRILLICTGNSCRSQMAEGWLRSFDERLDVFSAGIRPEKVVNPYAVEVMKEINIDISQHYPKPVDLFLNNELDFVITLCDNARKLCPVFLGNIKQQLHIGFDDPADAIGNTEEINKVYRNIRDQIGEAFYRFLMEKIDK